MSYEGLRLPRESVLVETVPSLALRSGDLSVDSKPVLDPLTGAPFPGNIIPPTRISQLSLNALKYLFPLPNTGAPNSISNNFEENFPTPVSSNQGDMRLDQNINSKQTVFARVTYKRREVETAPTGTVLTGPISQPENDFSVTGAYNYILTSHLVNEFRAGYTGTIPRPTSGSQPRRSRVNWDFPFRGLRHPEPRFRTLTFRDSRIPAPPTLSIRGLAPSKLWIT